MYLGIPVLQFILLFRRKSKISPGKRPIKKVLFIKFAAIGDIILLAPTLKLLKKQIPDCQLTFLCTSINYGMVKKIPYIDKIIKQDVYPFIYHFFRFIKFIYNMRKVEYDVVIDGEQWSRIDVIIMTFLKYKYSIGFYNKGQHKHGAFSFSVQHTNKRHEVENFFALLEPLGITPEEDDKKLEFDLTDAEKKFADEFWDENSFNDKTVICFQPSTGNSNFARQWKLENYIELGRKLTGDLEKLIVLVTGIKSDYDECKYISDGIGNKSICLAGKFDMNRDLAIIAKSKCIICSNTGILHLASSVGAYTIGLHGPNNPVHWGPYSKKSKIILSDIYCSPCVYLGHDFGCNAPFCMSKIKVDDVYLAVRKLLDIPVLN